ncbi:MAG TPA: peptidoglycan DD-metalloendopeptidase family protein [Oleiagrimonas sp.]|nr:peptidoglycan DD-metalloendopeptidase family protein [Oleiagrimonas sp.]
MAAPAPAHANNTDKQAAAKHKLAKVKKHIAALAEQARETAGQRSAINTRLAAQADKLSAAANAVRKSDQAIAANQKKLNALNKQGDTLQHTLDAQSDALADLLRAAYKIQPGSDLRLLLGDADLAKLSRALAYSRYFQHDRVEHIRQLLAQLRQLDQVKAEINRQHQSLEAARADKREHLAALKQARQKQQALLAQVNARLDKQHQQMGQLKRDRQSLEDLLVKLRNVFADIPDQLPDDTPFAKRRGKLPWPLHGKTHKYGDGLHIRAKRGAVVRAVAHGRVAFADWMRGYGLLVIIDHGHGWLSLYGNNESLRAGVGDWVRAGQPIATAGASVGDNAGIYFGLRHDGKAVNPLPWLAKDPKH